MDELRKAFDEAIRNPSEDIARTILAQSGVTGDDMQKSISLSTGLVGYDLQAPAKNLYPVLTPIRNVLPRVPGKTGTATNWRVVKAITGSGYNNSPWVPEGKRAGVMSYTEEDKAAAYRTLGEEDDITFEAISAAWGFEDLMATMGMRLLQKTFMKEEAAILAGNYSTTLSVPATPTVGVTGTGGTIPGSPTTYYVSVVALTLEGYLNSSLTNGVATVSAVTGADGDSFNVYGGSSAPTVTPGSVSLTTGDNLTATVTPVDGAVAYAWYVGTTGAQRLEAITTINSVYLSSLAGTHQLLSAVSGDHSKNTTAFDGLLTTALITANGSSLATLATGTAGTGTVLTSSGRGSVDQIDARLVDMWETSRLSPSVIYVNAQEARNITNKVLNTGSAPLLNYFQNPKDGEYRIAAGGVIEYYYNPYAVDGGTKIPIKIHPYMAPGTIFMYAERLPAHYQSNNVPNVAEMHVLEDYRQIVWPLKTRKRQTGVYARETLAVYFPPAMSVIRNIGNG